MDDTSLNGTVPPAGEGPEDGTLGGYFDVHDRPPAFEGSDGHPYTVSLEVERTADLRAPFAAYLVFPRWATTGVGIVGHVETGTIGRGPSEEAARAALASLTLVEVQALLEHAIEGGAGEDEDETTGGEDRG